MSSLCSRCGYGKEHCQCRQHAQTDSTPPVVQPALSPSQRPYLNLFKSVDVPSLECQLCGKVLGLSQRVEKKRHGEMHEREGLVTAHRDQSDPLCVTFHLKESR